MASPTMPPPPMPGRAIRTLILLLIKISQNRLIRKLLKTQTGLFYIKTRQGGNMSEANAIHFIANHTSIPVPKIYFAFVHKGTAYIIMRHIKGRMAASGWVLRSEESQTRILEQLRGMITELRSIPPPEGTKIGSVDGGPFFDCRLPKKFYWGPFATIREFHHALSDNSPWHADCTNFPDLGELFAFYQQAEESRLVLTHGDLSSLNILVDGDSVVGIVDWETAGWFPPYWEYTTAKYVDPYNPFWEEPVDRFITPMPQEWKMETIRRKHFGDF
ncbi:kinase-like protein [Sodiomyces alkalinus F11]|uniref:Kinase-like protein n=1 Tax=Sodiomyces alkalinus (strain CBS 110278 / VKM F-3762 / F11) TaxID=1314773 RepID=A0A3N2PVS4_SODAK|nr:kinase-like protein [Sodiomyces alkalinus F11]ROT38610.1 kinase-like protein [Sodiomyces alkalinus F11]